jgi:hypothetical protein
MHNRDTQGPNRSSRERPLTFHEEKLERDIAVVISRMLIEGKEFIGHDGRKYTIILVDEREAGLESFIDVIVKLEGGHQIAAKYVILLQQISRRTTLS